MRAIDTNVLVRLLARDDVKQTAAAERFVAGGAWVSHLVLVETTWVLSSVYERDATNIADVLAVLLEHESLVIQEPDVVARALASFVERPALGFSDCLIVETARKAGHLPIGSFDRALSRFDDVEKLKG